MPMYEYQCEACGLVFESRQKFSDAPLTECRECQGKVNKLISQTGFALKGGGWYDQGYNKGGSSGDKTESESKSKSKPKPDSKSKSPKSSTAKDKKTASA